MLPSAQRLTARRDFSAIYRKRQSVAGDFLVLYRRHREPTESEIRFGFVVSRKVGKSHDRNRIKRRLRAIARSVAPRCISGHDIMIVAKPGASNCSYADLVSTFESLLAQSGLLAESAPE